MVSDKDCMEFQSTALILDGYSLGKDKIPPIGMYLHLQKVLILKSNAIVATTIHTNIVYRGCYIC